MAAGDNQMIEELAKRIYVTIYNKHSSFEVAAAEAVKAATEFFVYLKKEPLKGVPNPS